MKESAIFRFYFSILSKINTPSLYKRRKAYIYSARKALFHAISALLVFFHVYGPVRYHLFRP